MATWQEHLGISLRFRDQGFAEIDSGDLLQGSEKLWGAAAHAVKAAAEQRGWKHNGHAYLHKVVDDLDLETGDTQLMDAFRGANRLHVNFYENAMDLDEISQRGLEALNYGYGPRNDNRYFSRSSVYNRHEAG